MENEKATSYDFGPYEIDFIDLFWRLLYQWKAILLFALIMAACAAFAGLHHDRKQYYSQVEIQRQQGKQILDDAIIEEYTEGFGDNAANILAALDDTDRNAVSNLLRLEVVCQNEKDYFTNSIYMNLDPNHVRKFRLNYLITGLEKNDGKYMDVLLREYQKFIGCDMFIEDIKNGIDKDKDKEYIRQLIVMEEISVNAFSPKEKDGVDSFSISIILPDNSINTEEIERVITGEMGKFCGDLSKGIARHDIQLIRSEEYTTTDLSLLLQKNDWSISIADLTDRAKTIKDTLQGKQRKAYEMIKASASNERKYDDEEIWRELYSINEPSISKKYVVLGFLSAIFIYVMIYLLMLLKKGICYSPYSLEQLTKKRIFGIINLLEHRSGWRSLFGSPLVDRIRKHNKPDTDVQLNETVLEVFAICKYRDITDIKIIADIEHLGDQIEELKNRLISHGIGCEYYDYKNIKTDEYYDMTAGMLAVRENMTDIHDVKQAAKRLFFSHVDNIGFVYYR